MQKSGLFYIFFFFATIICLYLVIDLKYQALHQAYFWDELNVYFRAASHQYRFGLSLLPGSVPDEFSRGHPLLVPFYFALNFRLFGFNPLTAHIAAAFLSSIGFLFVFLSLKKYIREFHALLVTLCVLIQPAFLSQSIMLLPEMPLFAFCSASVYFYINRRHFLAGFFALLALQCKESAIILPLALILTEIFLEKRIQLKSFFLLFLMPLSGLAAFLILQNERLGYYFFPLHTGLTKLDAYYINERWQEFKSFVFWEQGHWLFIPLLVPALLRWKQSLNPSLLIPVFFIGGLCFTVLNYYLSRYLLFFLAPFYAYLLMHFCLLTEKKKYLSIALFSVLGINAILHWKGEKYTDIDFSYTDHIENMKQTLEYLRKDEFSEKRVLVNFPFYPCYMDDGNGYDSRRAYDLRMNPQDTVDYKVFTEPGNMYDTASLTKGDSIIAELRSGIAFSRIYQIRSLPQAEK